MKHLKRFCIFVFCISFISITYLICTPEKAQAKDSEKVLFEDKALEEDVRDELGKETGSIYRKDLRKIKEIYTSKVKSLKGIGLIENLESLYIDQSNLSDISELSKLKKLKELTINYTKVNNIDLEGLSNLKDMDLSMNSIKNIDSLKGLTKLEDLDLSNNCITNTDALKDLTNLKYLNLSNNKITNIDTCKDLKNILHLDLRNNSISDIESLKNLSKLSSLFLNQNQIENIQPLQYLNKLEELYLPYNKLGNSNGIQILSKMKQLKDLIISNNGITDIKDLYELQSLDYLIVDGNKLSSIKGIEKLKKLEVLSIENNQISDITPLCKLPHLLDVYLKGNLIKEYSPVVRNWYIMYKEAKSSADYFFPDFPLPNRVVKINGKYIDFDKDPRIKDKNNTFVSAEYLLKGMGFSFHYDENSGTVIGEKGKKLIQFSINSKTIKVNNKKYKSKYKIFTKDGVPFIPLELTVQKIGGKVKYTKNTFVSAEYLLGVMGFSIHYDENAGTITGKKGKKLIQFFINSKTIKVNNKEYKSKYKTFTKDGVTFIPLELTAQKIGGKVKYNKKKIIVRVS